MGNPIKSSNLDGKQLVDTLVESVQRGWMPCTRRSPGSTQLGRPGRGEPAPAPTEYVSQELREGRLRDRGPGRPSQRPKIANWRTGPARLVGERAPVLPASHAGYRQRGQRRGAGRNLSSASVNWREAHPASSTSCGSRTSVTPRRRCAPTWCCPPHVVREATCPPRTCAPLCTASTSREPAVGGTH